MSSCPIVWSIVNDDSVVASDDFATPFFMCRWKPLNSSDVVDGGLDVIGASAMPSALVLSLPLRPKAFDHLSTWLIGVDGVPVVAAVDGSDIAASQWRHIAGRDLSTFSALVVVPITAPLATSKLDMAQYRTDHPTTIIWPEFRGHGYHYQLDDGRDRYGFDCQHNVNHADNHRFIVALSCALAHGHEVKDGVTAALSVLDNDDLNPQGWPKSVVSLPTISVMGGEPADSVSVAPFARCDTDQLGIYPVVDSVSWIERLLEIGVTTLQLRIKDADPDLIEEQIAAAVVLGQRYHARLFINDYWQLAIKHGAYGVHLGQEDIEVADLGAIQQAGLHLGLSTHGYFEIARAHQLAPSYIALGHIFPTPTKQMKSAPQGLARLSRYAGLLAGDYPTVAIGGINLERAKAVAATGVGSIAVVRAITEAADPRQAYRDLQAVLAARCGGANE